MRKCIHAFTPAGCASYPPYFNFSDVGDGEHAELTVRDHPQMVQHENGAYYEAGHQSTIAVHRDELVKLAHSILDWAGARSAPQSRQPKVDVAALVATLPCIGFADGEVPMPQKIGAACQTYDCLSVQSVPAGSRYP